ncbi:hypothetical protein RSO01_33310 [Reyranella soli]|uniref:Uncharacterized protein n=1 Tax=Reyranella soli TaxID=1230389 RepID=A0A512NB52_9HYPH|nr:hypothetical protein RSO01_33310 [Reyranella soli]
MKSKIRSDILARKWTGEGLVAHYFLALAAYAFGFDRGVARKRRWSAFRVAARLDFASSLNHPTSRLTVGDTFCATLVAFWHLHILREVAKQGRCQTEHLQGAASCCRAVSRA